MLAGTINNPPVPYRAVLPIKPGKASSVTISGTATPNCKRFRFNFETRNGDLAFHFNPRFEGANVVVRNTRINGKWGSPDKDGGFPFQKGGYFTVLIILGDNQYRTTVNGKAFSNYKHRISKEDVTDFSIEGDVVITQISFQHGKQGPPPPALVPLAIPTLPVYQPPSYQESDLQQKQLQKAALMEAKAAQFHLKAQNLQSQACKSPGGGDTGLHNAMGSLSLGQGNIIHTPAVPYRGYLPMAPGQGSSVVINGTVPTWCNRFQFNLEADNGDVAMHFNPRFEGMNSVIRNSCRSGSWGSEEKQGYFPFQLGAAFEVVITIEDSHYKINVNGQHFCDYRHRIPKDYARQLTIEGDIQVSQINFRGGNTPLCNPPMPVNVQIPGGMHPGKMVRINGQTSYNPSRFNVNLVHGSGYNSNADIGLHCDVRFNFGDSHNVVVRTHRQHGGYGQEERHSSHFPFVPGQPWEMIVRAEHDKYMIAVNNQHMFEFRHRMHPMSRFDHLFIEGDVNISMVQFQ